LQQGKIVAAKRQKRGKKRGFAAQKQINFWREEGRGCALGRIWNCILALFWWVLIGCLCASGLAQVGAELRLAL
jgi:hypothetical protein